MLTVLCFFYNSLKTLLAFHISSVSSVSRLSVVLQDSLLFWTQNMYVHSHLCCVDTCLCLQLSAMPAFESCKDLSTHIAHVDTCNRSWYLQVTIVPHHI